MKFGIKHIPYFRNVLYIRGTPFRLDNTWTTWVELSKVIIPIGSDISFRPKRILLKAIELVRHNWRKIINSLMLFIATNQMWRRTMWSHDLGISTNQHLGARPADQSSSGSSEFSRGPCIFQLIDYWLGAGGSSYFSRTPNIIQLIFYSLGAGEVGGGNIKTPPT